jgi:hypothetical protein
LHFEGDEGRAYLIETSTDLEHWTPLGEAIDKGRGQFEFIDEATGPDRVAFYRVTVP